MTPAIAREVVQHNPFYGLPLGAVCVVLPWIILYFGGLGTYLYVLVGFALIMTFLNRGDLWVRARNWKATRSQRDRLL
jgi:hypothetical protein